MPALIRRGLLKLVAGIFALCGLPNLAPAQSYPTRPVHLLVGFSAGGGVDIVARLMGERLADKLGQPFVIENRGGAGGNLATEGVVRAPADGYTLLLCGSWDAINRTLDDKLKFNFIRDITPVAAISRGPNVLVVNPNFPAKTLPEFVAYSKANPDKVNFASAGAGTVPHLAGELFKVMAGVNMVHVPYRGMALALNDVVGEHVQASYSTMPPAVELIKSGRLRALAVTSSTRSETLPDVQAIGELLPGYEATLLYGIGAPRNLDAAIVARLNTEINAALSDPKISSRLSELGSDPTPMTAAAFGKLIADETEKWSKVIREANIKAP